MSERPERVPEDAFWSEGEGEWISAPRDEDGNYHGLVRYYRPDGTLCCATEHRHGTPHGEFCRYHENGEVSRSGVFVEGKLHGTNAFFRSTGETTENFPAGLGDVVWRAEMDYRTGRIVEGRIYDRQGRRIMENGEPFPETRPACVPEDATFRKSEIDNEYRWVAGQVDDRGDGTIARQGRWRYWAPDGTPVREIEFKDGKQQGLARRFDEQSGRCLEEAQYLAGEKHGQEKIFDPHGEVVSEISHVAGKKHGSYLRRVDDGDMADPEIVFERGSYDEDTPVGLVEWLGRDHQVLATVDRGDETDGDLLAEVANAPSSTDFVALAGQLKGRRQHAAWLVAAARAVARGAPLSLLQEVLRTVHPPLSEEHARGLFNYNERVAYNAIRFGGPRVGYRIKLNGALLGAPVAATLRSVAILLDDYGVHEAALDHVDAALALTPERKDFEFTRALIRMSLGRPQQAAASVAALREHDEGQAAGMGGYLAALFPTFDYWPARDGRAPAALELEGAPTVPLARSPEQLRWLIQAIATRLERLRQAQLDNLDGETPEWLLPSLSSLLPQGPLSLEQPDAVDPDGGIVGLNHLIRAEWERLCWVCWLAGLDDVGLPRAGSEPRDLGRLLAVQQCWLKLVAAIAAQEEIEAEDALQARLFAAPWFGQPLGELWCAVADFAQRDALSLVQTMAWLADGDRRSPFAFDEDDDEEEEDDDEDHEDSDD